MDLVEEKYYVKSKRGLFLKIWPFEENVIYCSSCFFFLYTTSKLSCVPYISYFKEKSMLIKIQLQESTFQKNKVLKSEKKKEQFSVFTFIKIK